MSLHPSLNSSTKNRKQRAVLTRVERIKYLQEKGLFSAQTPLFGLPKIKAVKIKIKKEKAAEKASATGAGATGAPTSGVAAKPSKAASSTKAASPAKPAK